MLIPCIVPGPEVPVPAAFLVDNWVVPLDLAFLFVFLATTFVLVLLRVAGAGVGVVGRSGLTSSSGGAIGGGVLGWICGRSVSYTHLTLPTKA